MSLLDNVRQTLNDVTENVVERGQHLSSQAKLQMQIKKLQLDRAKRLHELGNKTFDWYQSGNLTVGGPVPVDVSGICHELADIQRQIDDTQHQLDEAKRQAEDAKLQAAAQAPLPTTIVTVTAVPDPTPPPPPSAPAGPTPPPDHSTVVLPNTPPPIPMPPANTGPSDLMRS